MKKISVVVAFAFILLSSCKKEGSASGNNYHLSFTVDGVRKSYAGYVIAHADTTGGDIELTILGSKTNVSYDDYLGIYLNNYPGGGNIPAGEYKDNSTSFTVLSTFQNTVNGNEYEAGQTVYDDAAANNITIANHFKVNITTLDGKTAKGTFSGDYYQDGDATTNKISITNGEFYMKFQ